ncbi:hypothetical protein D3C80_1900490 [compost metagenome]
MNTCNAKSEVILRSGVERALVRHTGLNEIVDQVRVLIVQGGIEEHRETAIRTATTGRQLLLDDHPRTMLAAMTLKRPAGYRLRLTVRPIVNVISFSIAVVIPRPVFAR